METDRNIRWQQRFVHFQQAWRLLKEGLDGGLADRSELEKEGLVQRFEYTFELAWKTIKDYLQFSGVDLTEITPRRVLKAAFTANIIANGEIWIEMLGVRNKLSYVYDQNVLGTELAQINQHFAPEFAALVHFFAQRLEKIK